MRITFGIHRGDKVEDLHDDELQKFLEWIEERDGSWSRFQEKGMKKTALAISREINRRSADEAAAEEEEERAVEELGPQTVLHRLTGSAVKLLLALQYVAQREKVQPFPAPSEELRNIAGIRSKTTFAAAKGELLDLGVLSEPTRAEFRLSLEGPEYGLSSVLSSLLFVYVDSDASRSNTPESPDYVPTADLTDAARVGWKILSGGKEPSDENIRFARAKLRHLLTRKVDKSTDKTTIDDAMLVVRWAYREYKTGKSRFAPLLDLVYIWSTPRFDANLSAAKTMVTKEVSVLESPDERSEIATEFQETLKRKGIK